MRKGLLLVVLIFILIFVSGCESWYSKLSPSGMVAADFAQKMVKEDFESAYELLNEEMKIYYSSFNSLKMQWGVYKSIFGKYSSISKPKLSLLEDGKEMYSFPVIFSKAKVKIEIIVQNNLICGLNIPNKGIVFLKDPLLLPDPNNEKIIILDGGQDPIPPISPLPPVRNNM